MVLIEANNLGKVYGDGEVKTVALRDATFSIESGEFAAIIGPSGSGKSTLLHILGFLDKHTGGEYRFDGKTIYDYTGDELAHIRNAKMGFVFQAFNLLPRVSVLENVKLPLQYSGVPESAWNKKAESAIESVGLTHRIHHEPSELSGGEKQRVAIARALVLKPQVIFADEPTGNLDSKSGKAVMEILQGLSESQGHTVVLITHEIYTAEHAERIIELKDGVIVSDSRVAHRHEAKQEFKK